MRTGGFTFGGAEGTELYVYRWLPDSGAVIKAAVSVAHGMAETAARYERFAAALTAAGFAVYAQDLRGHGRTAGIPEIVG